MKYIEELECGDTFSFNDKIYLLTADFRSDGKRLSYSLENGFANWIGNTTIVDHTPIYVLDKDNNTIPVKITKKTDVSS